MISLTKAQILEALAALDQALKERGVIGEVCIFGGAAMMLAFDARPSTRDVDAIFAPEGVMAESARSIAQELDLPEDWLNDGVKGLVSTAGDVTDDGLPRFSHLRLIRPTAPYLLAMKCLAARVGGYGETSDRADVITLCIHLDVTTHEALLQLVSHYYPDSLIPVKTRYFTQEIIQEISPVN